MNQVDQNQNKISQVEDVVKKNLKENSSSSNTKCAKLDGNNQRQSSRSREDNSCPTKIKSSSFDRKQFSTTHHKDSNELLQ